MLYGLIKLVHFFALYRVAKASQIIQIIRIPDLKVLTWQEFGRKNLK